METETWTYTREGESWEVRGEWTRQRWGEDVVTILEMRGDPASYFGDSAIILAVEELEAGWARYTFMEADPDLQETSRRIYDVELARRRRNRGEDA